MTNVVRPFYQGNIWEVLENVKDELPQEVEHLTLQITRTDQPGWYHVSKSLMVLRGQVVQDDD